MNEHITQSDDATPIDGRICLLRLARNRVGRFSKNLQARSTERWVFRSRSYCSNDMPPVYESASRAAESISHSRPASFSLSGINHLLVASDGFFPERILDRAFLDEVNGTSKQRRQFIPNMNEIEQRQLSGIVELDQYIHVAIGAKVASHNGSEQREPDNGVASAEIGNLLRRDMKTLDKVNHSVS